MANPNALSFRSFRIADEEAKRKRLEEKKQIELKEIAEKAAIQRALDEEQRRIETEQFRKKRNETCNQQSFEKCVSDVGTKILPYSSN